MTMVARKVNLLGVAEYRDEGEKMLKAAGDAVVVRRGTLRSVLMRAPTAAAKRSWSIWTRALERLGS
jgi:hypothetical protein